MILAPELEEGHARGRSAPEELLRIIRRRWQLIAAIVAIALIVGAIAGAVLPKRYRATAIGVVAPLSNTLTPSEAFHGVEALDRRSVVATVAALPVSLPPQANYDISAAVLPNTNLVRIDVDAQDPNLAASVANTTLNDLGAQTTSMFKYYGVTRVTRAMPPSIPVAPHRGRIGGAAFVIGLILAVGVAYVLETR
ncbi:MAG TPA: Wzz/FepE/Etk N-terminal domain-containing protein [Vicinamibacterales bacterium]